MAHHGRSQAYRRHVPLQHHYDVHHRRVLGPDPAARTPSPGAGISLPHSRAVQPGVHAARRDDGVPLHHPRHPRRLVQLHLAADDRRERRRVPQAQSHELVPLLDRRLLHDLRDPYDGARHGLDVLRSVLVERQSDGRHRRHVRCLHPGLLVDPHGAQLHRHDPQAPRARHHVLPFAARPLGDLRDEPHPGSRDARPRHHAAPPDLRARVPHRHLRSEARWRPRPLPALLLVL